MQHNQIFFPTFLPKTSLINTTFKQIQKQP